MVKDFISYGKQWIDEEDIIEVTKVFKSDFLTQGPKVKEFEDAICNYTGAKYCVVVVNGTAALHLAIAAHDIPEGREGITTPITFMATANAMVYNNIIPVFADIDQDTYNISPDEINKQLSDKTSVLIPVHFAGQACDMKEISSIAKSNNLYVIEDAAHAIGSHYADGTKVGNCKYSDMTTFSFHPVKTITTGEGGAVTTNNFDLYNKLIALRSHGIVRDRNLFEQNNKEVGPWYHEMQMLGFNYRLTDIQAALGMSQLKKLNSFIKRRKEIVIAFNSAFANINWIKTPYEEFMNSSAFHLYVLQADFKAIGKSRTQVMNELRKNNIGTQVYYIPIYLQPYYKKNFNYNPQNYPHSEYYYKHALSIPLYPKMTNEEVNYVIEQVLNLPYD